MSTTTPLRKREVSRLLKKYPEWQLNKTETVLTRTFSFESHVEALVFIARITVHAEVLNHHPDITFTYQTVKLKLTTHEQKGLTKKDAQLLTRIEGTLT